MQVLRLEGNVAEELCSVLSSVLGDLSTETADTDNAVFRRTLLERRRLLEGIVEQLRIVHPT